VIIERSPDPRTQWWVAAAALAVTLVIAASGCGRDARQPPPAPPLAVSAMTVVTRDVPLSAVYVAQTQSSQAVNIQARVSGFLEKRRYTEGSTVKAGTVLFEMDKKPFQAQVDAQRNEIADLKARLAALEKK
jgi:membrane fusion protein (multidrug efflux system)